MKIEFLNPERTEARLTRGWFRKETARVVRRGDARWFYQPSNDGVNEIHRKEIEVKRNREICAERPQNWTRVSTLPIAIARPSTVAHLPTVASATATAFPKRGAE